MVKLIHKIGCVVEKIIFNSIKIFCFIYLQFRYRIKVTLPSMVIGEELGPLV